MMLAEKAADLIRGNTPLEPITRAVLPAHGRQSGGPARFRTRSAGRGTERHAGGRAGVG